MTSPLTKLWLLSTEAAVLAVAFLDLIHSLIQVHPELDDNEVTQLFAAIDVNQSGNIDSTEFVAATFPSLNRERQEELDRRGSGFIPKQDLKDALFKVFCCVP